MNDFDEKRVLLHHYCGVLHKLTEGMPFFIRDGEELTWYHYGDRIKALCDELCEAALTEINDGQEDEKAQARKA